jgi:hypothetical protein
MSENGPHPFLGSAELSRLQQILDAACQELNIQDSNASRHVRELLGRQLIVLRDTSEYDDEALLKRIVDRARLLGFDPDPGVIAERFQRLIGDI